MHKTSFVYAYTHSSPISLHLTTVVRTVVFRADRFVVLDEGAVQSYLPLNTAFFRNQN